MTEVVHSYIEEPTRRSWMTQIVKGLVMGRDSQANLLAAAQERRQAQEEARAAAFAGGIMSGNIRTPEDLTRWLDENPRHQHDDLLFLDTPPGADPELT